jgi:hypothetical protein
MFLNMLMYIMIVCIQTQDCHSVIHFDTFTSYFNIIIYFFVNLINFLRPVVPWSAIFCSPGVFVMLPWIILHPLFLLLPFHVSFMTGSSSYLTTVKWTWRPHWQVGWNHAFRTDSALIKWYLKNTLSTSSDDIVNWQHSSLTFGKTWNRPDCV